MNFKPGDKVKLNEVEKARLEALFPPETNFSLCEDKELTIERKETEMVFVEGKGFISVYRLKGGSVMKDGKFVDIKEFLIPATGIELWK